MANKPQVTIDITQDPYQLPGQLGISGRSSSTPKISINNVVGADLSRLDMPHMLEVLRSVYERKGNKLIYRPRTFRVSTQAGTLTDIQASMFKRFQTDQEEINRLLDFLTPLIPSADKEDCDAMRELVRDDLRELVEEAGWLGGPRKFKMDEAFHKCDDHLLRLQVLFGLDDVKINTLAEAENWSKFVTIDETFNGLKNVFESYYLYFDRVGVPESFGNQIIWLSRVLQMIEGASVRMQFQLRALFVGPEELAAKNIIDHHMTIAELLDWTSELCDKGALISTRTGRSGIQSLTTDLSNLKVVYEDLQIQGQINIAEIYDPDVQSTITGILGAITDAVNITSTSGRAPYQQQNAIVIHPTVANAGDRVKIYVYGPDLKKVRDRDLMLSLESGPKGAKRIERQRVDKVQANNTFLCTLHLDKKVTAGTYDLVIRRKSDNNEILRLPQAFAIQ